MAQTLLLVGHVAIHSLRASQTTRTRFRYSNILRCIGQTVEGMDLKALEVRTHNEQYVLQIWNKGPSLTMNLERQFTLDDITQLDAEARKNRKPFSPPPNLLTLSQVLRLAGNYVDAMRGRLIRVSWQDQSDTIQAVTIQYEALESERHGTAEAQSAIIEELCIHVYKRKKKIAAGSDKSTYRPLVRVSNAS